jgi:hypothetical protein
MPIRDATRIGYLPATLGPFLLHLSLRASVQIHLPKHIQRCLKLYIAFSITFQILHTASFRITIFVSSVYILVSNS